jgi:hypothetical protein
MITYTFFAGKLTDVQADKRLHRIIAALKAAFPSERVTVTWFEGGGEDSASSDAVLTTARSVK